MDENENSTTLTEGQIEDIQESTEEFLGEEGWDEEEFEKVFTLLQGLSEREKKKLFHGMMGKVNTKSKFRLWCEGGLGQARKALDEVRKYTQNPKRKWRFDVLERLILRVAVITTIMVIMKTAPLSVFSNQ